MKASRILAENVSALLKLRGLSQHDLAQWCRHSDVWLSNFLAGKRQIQLKDLDRMADMLGVVTYQLFQPGIAPSTERRKTQRRSGTDRRISHQTRVLNALAQQIEPHRRIDPRRSELPVSGGSGIRASTNQQGGGSHGGGSVTIPPGSDAETAEFFRTVEAATAALRDATTRPKSDRAVPPAGHEKPRRRKSAH